MNFESRPTSHGRSGSGERFGEIRPPTCMTGHHGTRTMWLLVLAACGNRGESTSIMNTSRSATPSSTWVYRLCNDTQLEIEHLFFASEGSTDAILGTSLAPGSCSSYAISVGLHHAFDLRFLAGANDQYALRGKAPGLLPYGAWSFHIQLVDRAKPRHRMLELWSTTIPPCGRGSAITPVKRWIELLFYGEIGPPDLAAGECSPYHPADEPSGLRRRPVLLGRSRGQVRRPEEARDSSRHAGRTPSGAVDVCPYRQRSCDPDGRTAARREAGLTLRAFGSRTLLPACAWLADTARSTTINQDQARRRRRATVCDRWRDARLLIVSVARFVGCGPGCRGFDPVIDREISKS